MVEMTEVANILRNATSKSLLILDEIGRGTSTFDGLSIAWAVIEYISNSKLLGAKTLFATHYHELTEMENKYSGIKNVHVKALEEEGNITFLHKVLPGSVDKSYGINVAKLADLPNNIIDRANELLVFYENKSNKKEKVIKQFTLDLDTKTDILREYIKTINPLEVTPMQAINILDEIKKKSEE